MQTPTAVKAEKTLNQPRETLTSYHKCCYPLGKGTIKEQIPRDREVRIATVSCLIGDFEKHNPPGMSSPYHCDVEITFPSASLATIACNTLAVDVELQPDKIVRTLRVEGSSLLASFEATEARTLRVVLSGFYDMTSIVARTFLEFDNPGQDR